MRIAVLGAGYAGLSLARRLERSLTDAHEIVVVNDSADHLVQHEIHRAIRRPAVGEEIVVPIAEILDRARIEVARVEHVDPEAKRVELTDPEGGRSARAYENTDSDGVDEDGNDTWTLTYDVCAICLGAETNFQGVPGVAEHATPLKRLSDAEIIRAKFMSLLPEGGRVVVCGAGLSGIQTAGELAALAREEGVENDVEVVLTEALDRVAPNFPADFSDAIGEELRSRGIDLRVSAPVEAASAETITVDGTDLAYDQLIWTGGIQGSAALGGDRPIVKNTLELSDGTFVVGDAARVIDRKGEAVPASAQSAVREAGAVAESIETIVSHGNHEGFRPRLSSFDFDSPGWLVSIGDGAVAQVGPTVVRGRAATALKTTVGAGYLTSVGAITNAVDLAREELSGSPVPKSESGPERE